MGFVFVHFPFCKKESLDDIALYKNRFVGQFLFISIKIINIKEEKCHIHIIHISNISLTPRYVNWLIHPKCTITCMTT